MTDIYPVLRYRDARAAIAFLTDAFGFEERHVSEGDDGGVVHAELGHGAGVVMLGSARGDGPFARPPGAALTYVVVADPDAHHARARAAGAEIIQDLVDQPYGSREYGACDPEGNVWSFGTYRPE
jgi:uncharacterized glyoxalase superfamily protein PhnB